MRILITILVLFAVGCSSMAAQPAHVAAPTFPGESREMALVEVTKVSNDVRTEYQFKILHVYVGKIAHAGDRCSSGIAEYSDTGSIAPPAKLGQHGLFLVDMDSSGHLECAELVESPWFTNVMDDSARYEQFKELANDVEAYDRLPLEERAAALRKYAKSQTEEVFAWAIIFFSREFPDTFAAYAQDMIDHDRFAFKQQIRFVDALYRHQPTLPFRIKMLSKWAKAKPSTMDAATMATYILRETTEAPPSDRALLLATCIAAVLNKEFPIESRLQIVEDLGENARYSEHAEWARALRSILSSSNETALRDAATAALAHARSLQPPTAPAATRPAGTQPAAEPQSNVGALAPTDPPAG